MGDENDDQGNEEGQGPAQTGPKQLRANLDRANADLADLRRENLLLRSGLHDLPADRQQAILRSFPKDEEVTADKMKSVAQSFGWLPDPNANNTTDTNGQQQNSQNGQQQTQQTQQQTTDTTNTQDQTVASSIGELTAMEVAMIMAQRGTSDPTTVEDLSNKLRAAKSQAEVAQLISQQGPHMGILMDSDID